MHLIKKNPALFIILIVSVLLRTGAALYFGDQVVNLPGTQDQISYHTLAIRVLGGNGFSFGENWWPQTAANTPTAHWSFLYTLYLTLIYALFGPHPIVVRLLQAVVLGIAQPLLAYWLGRRLFGSTVGLVSAAITAGYVYFIYYTASLMTEPFYLAGILSVFILSIRLIDRINSDQSGRSSFRNLPLAAGLGLALGLTVLLRQVFLMFIPFLFLWIIWTSRKKYFWPALISTLVSGTVILFMILPFTAYNYIRFNSFVLLNTNAGYAFYFANHPVYGTHFEPILPESMGTYQDLIPIQLRHLDEAALDKALLNRGMQFVFDDPLRYLQLTISRIPAFFMFWPSGESGLISNISRVFSFGIFWPFMLFGAYLANFSRRLRNSVSPHSILISLFCLFYTAIHILSWALVRYRLPVDAVMIPFAALALVDIFQSVRRQTVTNQAKTASQN